MSDELRKANAALRAQIREMQSRAAAIGIPLPTGGVDLGTGERVPQFKVLGLEFGDATPYEQRYEDLLEAKTDIGKQVAEYNRAQADAATVAKFESQNLSNRQQSAMLAAEQRARFMGQEFDQAFQAKVMNASKISDIANQNFTAEQQVQLENSRAANTMNLQNLSNSQALVMAEAAALAQLDTANLNNRQQAAVQNAQNFLQVDMANLSNLQQTELKIIFCIFRARISYSFCS